MPYHSGPCGAGGEAACQASVLLTELHAQLLSECHLNVTGTSEVGLQRVSQSERRVFVSRINVVFVTLCLHSLPFFSRLLPLVKQTVSSLRDEPRGHQN